MSVGKERMVVPIFKKFASLLAALALCFALLPGQVRAAGDPEPPKPPVVVEPVDPETPDDPENLIQPMGGSEDMPYEESDTF